jgi:hypothetical protein
MKNVRDLKKEDLKETYYSFDYYGYCLSKVARNYFRVYLSSLTSADFGDNVNHATGTTNKNKSMLFDSVNEARAFLEDNKGISSFEGYEIERISLKINK